MTGFLASYWYFRKRPEAFDGWPATVPLLLDSGAFSAYTSDAVIDLQEYADWVADVRSRVPAEAFRWALNLDVIGDTGTGSYDNWLALREMGCNTVPVIHYGARPVREDAQAYLEHPDVPWFALGALVRARGNRAGWAAHALRTIRELAPTAKVHGLGVDSGSVLGRLPFDSTDSSGSTTVMQFGTLKLMDPFFSAGKVPRRRILSVRRGTPFALADSRLIRRLGCSPEALRDPTTFRPEAIALGARSVMFEEVIENARREKVEGFPPVTRFVVDSYNEVGLYWKALTTPVLTTVARPRG